MPSNWNSRLYSVALLLTVQLRLNSCHLSSDVLSILD